VTPGDAAGPTALIVSMRDDLQLNVDRDTPHKHVDANTTDDGITRDRSDLQMAILSVDAAKTSGTLTLNQFIFDEKSGANQRNELYAFTLNGDTLSLTETSVTFSKQGSGAPIAVDAGAQKLLPPMTFHRQPAFCGSGANFDCSEQFAGGSFKTPIPDACKGREDLCFVCQPDHTCATQVPSSCELSRFTCVDTIEHCEFGDRTANPDNGGSSPGEVTTVDPDGNPIDCKNSPTRKSVCCEVFNQKND
jgi:hypothetical protein